MLDKINSLELINKKFHDIKNKKPLLINNKTQHKKRIVFTDSIRPKNGLLDITIESIGSGYKILLLDSRFKYIRTLENNSSTALSGLNAGTYHLGATVSEGGCVNFTKVQVNTQADADSINRRLLDSFRGNTLLIAPGYPSHDNLYSHAFIHTRLKIYKDNGIDDIDVAVINDNNMNQLSSYTIDGVTVNNLSFSDARLLLQQKKYDRVLVHFFGKKYAQLLDSVDMSSTQIFIYTHGGDVLYRDYKALYRKYFEDAPQVTEDIDLDFSINDSILSRYSTYDNVHWIFSTRWCLERAKKLTGIEFINNTHIISNPISTSTFKFKQRKAKDRKKICIVRPFNELSSYSIDISVRTILELSKRSFFSDIEFNIYGDGIQHKLLCAPLRGFTNVKIHQKFLTSTELAEVYATHGIVLAPTRYDSQGVSACEAALTGAVVISSDQDTGLKDCIEDSIGTYCETENFSAYADMVEKLYKDPSLFLEFSEKMHKSINKHCSYVESVSRELSLLNNTKGYNKKLEFKPKDKTPVLTIAVPSYNVARYLKRGILSLVDHPLAHKIEVLIINDGSSDKTAEIGKELERLTSTSNGSIVRVVNKSNGGHGSTINRGIKDATGKYFRLMDGDDYFSTDALIELVKILENESSDIVLTNYVEDFSVDAILRPVRHYNFMTPGIHYDLDFMNYKGYGFDKWGPLLSTTTCRTDLLKKSNFKIDENSFYVDMEYNFIIYALSKSVVYYPLDVYYYYLGRAGQSMSKESFTRNYLHHERVTIRLIDEFIARYDTLSEGKRQYLLDKLIIPMCKSQYLITNEFHSTIKAFSSFDKKLKKYPQLYQNREIAGRVIRLHRATKGASVKAHNPMIKASSRIKKTLKIY